MDQQITIIPIEQLRECPFNPRQFYTDESMIDLAESIKAQGVMQPIVARPLTEQQQDINLRFEIVFGHRRYRASKMAKLEAVPVIVRAMTDQEVAIAQVHENVQRQDVTALEEADSLARLHREHKLNADQIAEAIGKSRSYVYGRLKLARMAPEVRKAVAEQGLSPDIGLELARIADHNLQRATLKELKEWSGSDNWLSVRQAKARMGSLWTNVISAAPFDPTDVTLAPKSGACAKCPRLARNDPDLMAALGPDVCTDHRCWEFKARAALELKLQELRREGHEVIVGEEAAKLLPSRWHRPEGLFRLDAVAFDEELDGKVHPVTYREAIERAADPAVRLTVIARTNDSDDELLHYFVSRSWADRVVKATSPKAGVPAEEPEDVDADLLASWSDAERAMADLDVRKDVRRAVIERLAILPRSVEELHAWVSYEFEQAGDFGLAGEVLGLAAECSQAVAHFEATGGDEATFNEHAWYRERIQAMSGAEAGRLIAAIAIDNTLMGYIHLRRPEARSEAAAMVAIAARYDVNPAAFLPAPTPAEQADAFATPSTAAQAQMGAVGKAKGKGSKWVKTSKLADDPEFTGEGQMDDAGSAGGSASTAEAQSKAARASDEAAGGAKARRSSAQRAAAARRTATPTEQTDDAGSAVGSAGQVDALAEAAS
jgi:ParB/RepB/Spo0J family partition protein